MSPFIARLLKGVGVPGQDARVTAEVLVSADLRGIDSHGVARTRRYVDGLRDGVMKARPDVQVVHETAVTALVDGGGGLGQVVGVKAMKLAMDKAQEAGVGFVAVRNSNHYGIAGYYSMMALERELIGISMTNAAPLVVPTFGKDAVLGTNPLSVAVPTGGERPFVLDMATSVVTRGKLEEHERHDEPLLKGWATDSRGLDTTDASQVLHNLKERLGGGILPLGGAGEDWGGHKGYGLALLVDILCGALPGAGYARSVYAKDEVGHPLPANIGHFFGALRVDAFRPVAEFKDSMDDLVRALRASAKAEGQERIYIHGEKEWETTEERKRLGIPLHPKVVNDLRDLAQELGVEGPL
ncbi:MAG TPA: Ldh family oxidoreductase [Chloroflexi bacterium]|nr:Ldh family oxidoreductase [Chloroflexota bacterium]